ncbi:9244_t:CDS:2 [Gigaspora rosea]|nr:9244_t:CDS:2 [Gigaspora rosea]
MTRYQETNTYPQNPIIKAQTKTYSFSYEIIQEGYYPLSPILAYTFPPNKYKIPDKYIVKTTFGKRSNQQIIKCSINYINNKPLYHIEFEDQIVESKKSASEAANLYQDALNKIAQLKNPYNYMIRENKHRNHSLKPFNQLANSSQKMRGQRFGIMIKDFVDQNSKTLFNSEDNVLLKQVLFSVNNVQYIINYGILDKYTEDL